MRYLLVLALLFFSNQVRAQNPVILLSIDGFAYDYLQQYQPKNILALAKSGAISKGMIPVFPSKTFPNHVSIVTGVYPKDHGIIHNKFYHRQLKQAYTLGAGKHNPKWLTAKPIWTHAEEHKIKTAIYFWPESETPVSNILPSFFFPYKHSTPNAERIEQIVDWLKLPNNERPGFIAAYFSTVDSVGHRVGTQGKNLSQAIEEIDTLIGYLLQKINTETKAKPNIILVSDHGMIDTGTDNTLNWRAHMPFLTDVHVINGQTQLFIYESDQQKLNDVRSQLKQMEQKQQFQSYHRSEFPKTWKLDTRSAVIPDLIVNAIAPYTFVNDNSHVGQATHGFDPSITPEMNALFIASGPNIQPNSTLGHFENIHVYALIEHLLALPPAKNKEADIQKLVEILTN